ncbi:hypothetical protein V8G54_001589 [Vigna mungo]|uniref:Uncharacterized protein n=1 Tax=Vigna mungo TaxID=3915 RepID=A0AAQ3P8K2_VIGMU
MAVSISWREPRAAVEFSSPSASRHVSWSVSAALSHVSTSLTLAEETILPVTVPSAEIESLRRSSASPMTELQTSIAFCRRASCSALARSLEGKLESLDSSSMATRSESLKRSSGSVVLDSGNEDMEEKQEVG